MNLSYITGLILMFICGFFLPPFKAARANEGYARSAWILWAVAYLGGLFIEAGLK